MNIAVLASTNGTDMDVLLGEHEHFTLTLVVCDRACGAVEKAKVANIPHEIVAEKDRDVFAQKTMELLAEHDIKLVVLIGFMKIIAPNFVEKWRNSMMNIHPSLLPAFAGGMDTNVHEEVLKRGCKITGCTLHFVDEGADTGPIIMQRCVPVGDDETVETLKEKVQKLEQEVIFEAVDKYAQGKIRVEGTKVYIE